MLLWFLSPELSYLVKMVLLFVNPEEGRCWWNEFFSRSAADVLWVKAMRRMGMQLTWVIWEDAWNVDWASLVNVSTDQHWLSNEVYEHAILFPVNFPDVPSIFACVFTEQKEEGMARVTVMYAGQAGHGLLWMRAFSDWFLIQGGMFESNRFCVLLVVFTFHHKADKHNLRGWGTGQAPGR